MRISICFLTFLAVNACAAPTTGSAVLFTSDRAAAYTSTQLAAALSTPEAQKSARDAWEQLNNLSPQQLNKLLQSQASNTAFTVDGIAISGVRDRLLAGQAVFDRLSSRYPTIRAMLAAHPQGVKFSTSAAEIHQEVGELAAWLRQGTGAALLDPQPAAGSSGYRTVIFDQASDPGNYCRDNQTAILSYLATLSAANSLLASSGKPTVHDSYVDSFTATNRDLTAAQWQHYADVIDHCPDPVKTLANTHPL